MKLSASISLSFSEMTLLFVFGAETGCGASYFPCLDRMIALVSFAVEVNRSSSSANVVVLADALLCCLSSLKIS